MANSYDFNINKGCSFLVYLNIQNSDGSYINLSGYSVRGYVKNQYSDSGFILNLNPTPIYPLESGILMISGAASDTNYLPAGEFNYDVEIYNSGDCSSLVLNGDFNIYPSTSYIS